MGKKKQPIYKVVAADSRSPRDGKFIESIGLYNPKSDPATIDIKEERALYWLGVGAQPTETVRGLLSKQGILLKKELLKKGLPQEEISKKLEEWNKVKEAKIQSLLNKKAERKTKAKPVEKENLNSAAEV